MIQKYWALVRKHERIVLVALVLAFSVATAAAQTATPVVEIEIPTGDMITNLNTWIGIFAPIMLFVGMIPVALGLLRYITNLFKSAFGGG